MRILAAKSHATSAITEACLAPARAVPPPGTEGVGWTNIGGPRVVDSIYADAVAGRLLARGVAPSKAGKYARPSPLLAAYA